jgi:uncharacterized protein (TIGR00369 family)
MSEPDDPAPPPKNTGPKALAEHLPDRPTVPATAYDLDAVSEDEAAYMELVRRLMEEVIPFNAYLGLSILDLGRGHASMLMPFAPHLIGNPAVPALHGGTLSALADTAGGASVFASIRPGDAVSTIDLRIDYLRPGAPLDTVAEAEVVRLGNRVGVARIRLWQHSDVANDSPEVTVGEDGDRRLIAEATGVYAIKRLRTPPAP